MIAIENKTKEENCMVWQTLLIMKDFLEVIIFNWYLKEYIKAIYCHLAYLSYMQVTSCEMPGWMKHKLESGLPGEISIT